MLILLTGFIGSGKSTLLSRLKKGEEGTSENHFFDLDQELIHRRLQGHGHGYNDIASYVSSEGWENFRRLELDVFAEILNVCSTYMKDVHYNTQERNGVVALGGGTLAQKSAVEIIEKVRRQMPREDFCVIWLDVPFELCMSRVSVLDAEKKNRPLLFLDREKLKSLYEERKRCYAISDVVIDQEQIIKIENIADLRQLIVSRMGGNKSGEGG